jgi:hypothetical protein
MTRIARLSVPLFAALALGCTGTDSPTVPSSSMAPSSSARRDHVGYGNPDTVLVLKRSNGLSRDFTESADIGPRGGTIRINQAGVTISFPAGALSQTVRITATAKAGYDVAYEFQPHGLVFAVPVTITQDVRSTWATKYPFLLPKLAGAYFEGAIGDNYVDSWHLFAKVAEMRGGVLQPGDRDFTFTINHFSGYALSTGRMADFGFDER